MLLFLKSQTYGPVMGNEPTVPYYVCCLTYIYITSVPDFADQFKIHLNTRVTNHNAVNLVILIFPVGKKVSVKKICYVFVII